MRSDLLHIKYLAQYMENSKSQVNGSCCKYMQLFLLILLLGCYIFLWIFTFKMTSLWFVQICCISFIMRTLKIFTPAMEDIHGNKQILKEQITMRSLTVGTINWWFSYTIRQSCKNTVSFQKREEGIARDVIRVYYISVHLHMTLHSTCMCSCNCECLS